jgi:hypothetical protein
VVEKTGFWAKPFNKQFEEPLGMSEPDIAAGILTDFVVLDEVKVFR